MWKSSILTLLAATFVLAPIAINAQEKKEEKPVPDVLKFKMKSLAGEDVDLSKYQGKVILIVNTASKCGYTPQYKDLQALYTKYQEKGFVILGFPANNFRAQEPGTDLEIAQFCTDTYGVTFPMFSKISVLGADKAPLYSYLTEKAPQTGDVKWNFEKFLIAKDGKVSGRYLSKITPTSEELVRAVESELNK